MKKQFIDLYAIDRAAIVTILTLSLVTILLILGGWFCWGDRCLIETGPKVREFSWRDRIVNAKDTAFVLKFDRPMSRESVENNLKITIPDQLDLKDPLPGKISWAGRRMAYTLDFPAPYGNSYRVELQRATEKFQGSDRPGKRLQPFTAEFKTPDRVFAYIGLEGKERGRLILYNFTQQEKIPLTPANLVITEFEPYPDGKSILFGAADRQVTKDGLLEQQLYRVTTGLYGDGAEIAGQIDLVLANEEYQILEFDLSADGNMLVVQRVNREDPQDAGLWVIRDNNSPVALNNPPGGVFLIAPDNQTIASTQGEGVALLSPQPDAEPLGFFAQFGMVLDFTPDGASAVMVDFNRNNPDLLYTRSLYLVNNQGREEKIFDTKGSILNCQFDAQGDRLYCLLTNLIEDVDYVEQPYIAVIDLDSKKVVPLTTLPQYQDTHLSLSPDTVGLIFDQTIVDPELTEENILRTDSGEAIATGTIWLLIPPASLEEMETAPQLEELPFIGFNPKWLP
ncbi:hypothetical protein [Spirulina sp. 06S082]|uniref:hypothetical protein n=1 Tax=Spirulina sp. 06S082 TaxID=3110248 RepID=UPI002B1FCEDF|nr:hypothetical protein [Spirulina sp. 06S082]MEA5467908.1 hypothetical protein [Spirulina sp. 06S082]